MKRDPDLIRAILLVSEKHAPAAGFTFVTAEKLTEFYKGDVNDRVIFEHVSLMDSVGMFARNATSNSGAQVGNLSMYGYDFLDSVRNPEIWAKTKDVANSAGAFTLDVLADVAKGFVKTQIKKHTGVDI